MIPLTAYSIFKMSYATQNAALVLGVLLSLSGSLCALAFEKGTVPPLGAPVSEHISKARDNLVFPDGDGLPAGSGKVASGAELYVQHCLLCHGPDARGGSAEELSGGITDLTRDPPDQTIGTYWPFATTLFDFIRRAMPMHLPGTLSNDDSYALTAYLLHVNDILPADAALDAESLKKIDMPNREGFHWIDVDTDGRLTNQ